jgi:type IV pilus assembly protein PilM
VVLSWDIIGMGSKKVVDENGEKHVEATDPTIAENKVRVLLVAASRNKVEKYEQLMDKVGLKLKSMEIESFSMVRSLVGNDPGNFIIVDIGSRVCNIILVEKGMIKANRNIDAGGKDITRTIAKSMGMEEMGAERIKISGKNFFSQESSVNLPSLDIISGEISRLISSSNKSGEKVELDGVILSGGTAQLTGISEYFSQTLGAKVIKGNPFSRISYDKKLEPILSRIGSQFSVCVGLALKGAENHLK